MPLLLELGARAAKGHEPSQELARRVLATMAEAAGRPFTPGSGGGADHPIDTSADRGAGAGGAPFDPVPAGIAVIKDAFATVLSWATGPDWPEGVWPGDDIDEPDDEEWPTL
jgi:hypothetical protein